MNSTRGRIASIFFLHAFTNAMMHTRVPDIQLAAGLNDAGLGIVLMGAPIGSMLVFPLASRAIEHYGTRAATLGAFVAMLAPVPLMPLAGGAITLFILMAVNGAGASLSAMAFNVEADRIEAATGRRVMNTCHGTWSVGYLIASSIGGGIRGAGISPELHLAVVTPLLLIAVIATLLTSSPAPARAFEAVARKTKFTLPSLLILSLVAVGLGAELLEGSARVWATILLRDSFDLTPWVQSSALPAMVVTMAIGRLLADRWIDRFGPARVARILLAISFIGLLAIAAAPNPSVVIIGFAIAGIGICVIYPLSISAAARIGDGPASRNVATLTLIIQIAMLIAPMITGFIAEEFGVRAAFGALLPVIALGWTMAGALEGKAPSRIPA